MNGGAIEPAHSIEVVCADCGFDLNENELNADTCSDCGASLNLKESVTIEVTSAPPMQGKTLE